MADQTQQKEFDKRMEEQRKEILKSFNEYDVNHDGFISLKEAHAVLEYKLGFQVNQTKKLLRMCDRTGDGQLSPDEFIDFYFTVRAKLEELQSIFNEFDKDHDGNISMEEAKDALRHLAFNDDEVEDLIRCYDSNDDGRLQFEEFVRLWNA